MSHLGQVVTEVNLLSLVDHVTDTHETSLGDLQITHLGHASILFTHQEKRIYVDPYSRLADYGTLPTANIILITHGHYDHLDPRALRKIRSEQTLIIHPEACSKKIKDGRVMHNGDEEIIQDLRIEATPSYSLGPRLKAGSLHPRGQGNGYVLTFGDLRVLVAGDTHDIPELKAQRGIDIAFLPLRSPFAMSPQMLADVALAMKPRILYPYHRSKKETTSLIELLQAHPEIELRTRPRDGRAGSL